jgi:ferredoxin-NADP reductase
MTQLQKSIFLAFPLLALASCSSTESAPDGSVDDSTDAMQSMDTTQSFTCGSAMLHSLVHNQCAAMDVQGEGECYCTSMGWVWDGTVCVELPAGFCSCKGADCDKLTATKDECLAAHTACSSSKPISCGSTALFQRVHNQCAAMDVQGEGACACTSMGWIWDGSACVELPAGFCSCKGADCDKLTATKDECLSAHTACSSSKPISCGSTALFEKVHNQCAAMDVQGEGECFCTSMGWIWDGLACVELPAGFCGCKGADCDKLTATKETCLAVHTACPSSKTISCGSTALFQKVHSQCAAMDVQGEGECFCTSMGWIWDGLACVELPAGFCNCKGADCDKLTDTKEACQTKHAFCL